MNQLLSAITGRREAESNLTPAQIRMYATEKASNFRSIAKICATRSKYTLAVPDLASDSLLEELVIYGLYAHVAYAVIDPVYVFDNLESLLRPDYPFEGLTDLRGTILISSITGSVASLEAIVAYRPASKQLIIGLSGTKILTQAIYDLHAWKTAHPVGQKAAVHAGFFKMYNGCKAEIMQGTRKGLKEYEVSSVVTVGHSIGAGLAQLVAFDLLYEKILPANLPLKVTGFGGPRVGNGALAKCWRELASAHEGGVEEYLVKAYNDGVPSLPGEGLGYKHMSQKQLYWYHGRLFHIPPQESEHGLFDVSPDALDASKPPEHPRGGHNYYNGKDHEYFARRLFWMRGVMGEPDWEKAYLAKVAKHERAWQESR